MKIRGKKINLSDLNIALADFKYHAHNATFSRKAVRIGKPYEYYYSKKINKMNDRRSVNDRMKYKLKRIRKDRYESKHAEIEEYKKNKKYILECQKKLKQSMINDSNNHNHK